MSNKIKHETPTQREVIQRRWKVQPDNLVGGFTITLAKEERTPADGALCFGLYLTQELAQHIVNTHNAEVHRIRQAHSRRDNNRTQESTHDEKADPLHT